MNNTFEEQVAHSTDVRLCFASDEAHALRLATVTWLRIVAEGILALTNSSKYELKTHPYRSTL